CAKATLHRTVLRKGFLHRVDLIALSQPLDRQHLVPLGFEGKNETRINRFAVQQHRTGAALALAAALLGTGQVQLFPQELQERLARLDRHFIGCTIHGQRNETFHTPLLITGKDAAPTASAACRALTPDSACSALPPCPCDRRRNSARRK